MTASEIVQFLATVPLPDKPFRWSAPPSVAPHMGTALYPTWLRIGHFLAAANIRRYAAIGCLVGTLEAHAIQNYGWSPSSISFFDLDIGAYNPLRNTGSYAYDNICNASVSAFQGEFGYLRVDSTRTQTFSKLAPYDCVLVDGCHAYDALRVDMQSAYDALAEGGVMFVHDLELPDTHLDRAYFDWIGDQQIDHAEAKGDVVILGLGVIVKSIGII